jgi:hypothetical protein
MGMAVDTNRERCQQGQQSVTSYQALCRELAKTDGFGELSTVGARSVLRRYSDAWFQAAKRRKAGQRAGLPRRRRALVPVRCYHGTFRIEGQRVRLPVAKGRPGGWWTSGAPPPPAQPANSGSPSRKAVDSNVRIVDCKGTGTWSAPTTSPPKLAADAGLQKASGEDQATPPNRAKVA